ncbi:MAG: hypothetical protein RL748_1077 [Pseudomonadota bacterium]
MIDSQTIQCALLLGNSLLAFCFLLATRREHACRAMQFLTCGKCMQTLAWSVSFYARDGWLMLTPLLLLGGLAFDAAALWESNDVSIWRKRLFGLCLAMLLWTGLVAVMDWHWGGKLILLALSLVQALAAWAWLQNWSGASSLRRSLALMAALLSIVLLAPILDLFNFMAQGGDQARQLLANPSLIQQLFVSTLPFLVMMLLNGFGFLLLELERQQAQLLHLALVDPLTDAPNRRSFLNALGPWLALARRPGQTTAVMILDLDHFKRINDNYGHAVGDQVLKAVVQIGMTQLRDSDMIGRLGGEEFAVLLPRTSLDDAMMVAERMRQAIMALQIKTEKAMLNVTASIGVTLIQADDTVVSLIKRANEAMDAAKNAGRNCVMQGNSGAGLMVS